MTFTTATEFEHCGKRDAPSRQGLPISKGYDADELIKWIQQTEALVVILPRSNRTVLRAYDKALYKEFNLVEWMRGYLQALPSGDNTVRQDLAPSRRLSSSRF